MYARDLLLPERRFWSKIRRSGADPWLLAQLNGVSVAAMLLRLTELGARTA